MAHTPTTFEHARERFFSRVQIAGPDDCWVWTGRKSKSGYGAFSVNNKDERSHRVAWALANGPIPDGLGILHKCDNPPCCNPSHLFAGTPADNAKDRDAKHRTTTGLSNGAYTRPDRRSRQPGESNTSAKLTAAVVADIRARYTGKHGELSAFARSHGVSVTAIGNLVRGRSWPSDGRSI